MARTVHAVVRACSRCRLPPRELGPLVRRLEVAIGQHVDMHGPLSLALAKAHADGGNVSTGAPCVRRSLLPTPASHVVVIIVL